MLEFGPLWLVALLVPPFLYGPHWAGLTLGLGLGGLLGEGCGSAARGRWSVRVALVACCLVLVVSDHAGIVTASRSR